MDFHSTLPAAELGRYFRLVRDAIAIRRHYDLLQWLQGDVQHYLPQRHHDCRMG